MWGATRGENAGQLLKPGRPARQAGSGQRFEVLFVDGDHLGDPAAIFFIAQGFGTHPDPDDLERQHRADDLATEAEDIGVRVGACQLGAER